MVSVNNGNEAAGVCQYRTPLRRDPACGNRQDVDAIAAAYSEDSEWRNRAEFVKGRKAIEDFLRRKWDKELQYVLRKYLW